MSNCTCCGSRELYELKHVRIADLERQLAEAREANSPCEGHKVSTYHGCLRCDLDMLAENLENMLNAYQKMTEARDMACQAGEGLSKISRIYEKERDEAKEKIADMQAALENDDRDYRKAVAERDAALASNAALQLALRHQAQRNHDYLPASCGPCGDVPALLGRKEPEPKEAKDA